MKRCGFTIMELIFVTILLAILASVAMVKLSGVTDDARVALEKSGIASVKSGLLTIHSRALQTPTYRDVDIEIDLIDGTKSILSYKQGDSLASSADTISVGKYPFGLSVSNALTASFDASFSSGRALAIVLEPHERSSWQTKQDGNETKIAGPASLTLSVESSAEYNQKGSWSYNPLTAYIEYNKDVSID